MSLREKLETMLEGMPVGSSVSLPVDWLRAQLEAEPADGDPPDELLTLEQVAQRVGRAEGTVRTWANSGDLEGAFKLNGRDWRVPASALERYIERQKEPNRATTRVRKPSDVSAWRKQRKQRETV
jgi:excisionase family DNA binding protein